MIQYGYFGSSLHIYISASKNEKRTNKSRAPSIKESSQGSHTILYLDSIVHSFVMCPHLEAVTENVVFIPDSHVLS